MRILYSFIITGLVLSCQSVKKHETAQIPQFREFQKTYLDSERNRDIPVQYYVPSNYNPNDKLPIVIFSHGYGKNTSGSFKEYSALLRQLASKGYFVASIQHELRTDSLLPLEGKAMIVRKSNWERGSKNIMYTYNRLKKDFPNLNYNHVIIAGHSNGGDMSALFTDEHPEKVWKLITLDQRRYPLPLYKNPKIYSLRSSDQLPDDGVLPNDNTEKELNFTIIKLKKTIHNDMDDSGNDNQKKEISNYVLQFLED